MTTRRSIFLNLVLMFGSVAFVIVITAVADRTLGMFLPQAEQPGVAALIFPAGAHHTYRSADFEYTVTTNDHGLRERPLPVHAPGSFLVAVIGDSFTYGWGVEAEETWVRQLETAFRTDGLDVTFLNLGKPGAGPDFYAEIAREAIPMLRPDLVVVGMLQNNDIASAGPQGLADLSSGLLDPVLWLYPNTVRWLVERQSAPQEEVRTHLDMPPPESTAEQNVMWTRNAAEAFLKAMDADEHARYDQLDPAARAAFEAGLLNPYFVDLALKNPGFYNGSLDWREMWMRHAVNRTGRYLAEVRRIAERNGARAVVVSVPDGPYVNREAWNNIQRVGFEVEPELLTTTTPDDAIAHASRAARLPFVTVTPHMREHMETTGLFFELDGHLTVTGHALFAEALAPELAAFIADAPAIKDGS